MVQQIDNWSNGEDFFHDVTGLDPRDEPEVLEGFEAPRGVANPYFVPIILKVRARLGCPGAEEAIAELKASAAAYERGQELAQGGSIHAMQKLLSDRLVHSVVRGRRARNESHRLL